MSYSSIDQVLFEKLHNIQLSGPPHSSNLILQICTKHPISVKCHDVDKNLKTLYLELGMNHNYDHKSYDARQ